jgi:hypothetical protein
VHPEGTHPLGPNGVFFFFFCGPRTEPGPPSSSHRPLVFVLFFVHRSSNRVKSQASTLQRQIDKPVSGNPQKQFKILHDVRTKFNN